MKFYPAALAALAYVVTGCASDNPKREEQWRQLADGSLLSEPVSGSNFQTVSRCWVAKPGFDCVKVFDGDGDIAAKRYRTTELASDAHGGEAGYSCETTQHGSQLTEIIAATSPNAGSTTLKKHDVAIIDLRSESEAFWKKEHVEQFTRDNAVGGPGYFDCPLIVRLVKEGSYLSISTTDLTYDQFLAMDGARKSEILIDKNDPLSGSGIKAVS